MDDVIDDILRAVRRCERAAKRFNSDEYRAMFTRFTDALGQLDQAWSGSWIGYQSCVYTADLLPKRPGEYFDVQEGRPGGRPRDWAEFNSEVIHNELLRRIGTDRETEGQIAAVASEIEAVAQECRADLLPTLDAVLRVDDDPKLREVRQQLAELPLRVSIEQCVSMQRPAINQIMMDQRALQGGIRPSPHMAIQGWLMSQWSTSQQAARLAEIGKYAVKYLERSMKMKGRSVGKTDGPVFIGHGRSAVWRDLKDFLQDRLNVQWEEFNHEPVAGLSNKERLLDMLDKCPFAFLVMTAEDEQKDGTLHARANVIHEAGLFQGRYGFERAIILLEEGCQEFSNVNGIGQIRFPKGNVMAKSEEIRRVLEREKVA